jgi:hypothetical protein
MPIGNADLRGFKKNLQISEKKSAKICVAEHLRHLRAITNYEE